MKTLTFHICIFHGFVRTISLQFFEVKAEICEGFIRVASITEIGSPDGVLPPSANPQLRRLPVFCETKIPNPPKGLVFKIPTPRNSLWITYSNKVPSAIIRTVDATINSFFL